MNSQLLYHGSLEINEFPEIRKPNIPKIFHGDFIVQTIMNKHKNGPIKKVKMELLMYIDLLKIQI